MVEDPHGAVASVEAEHDEDEPITAAALRTVASFDRSTRSARYDATSAAANASISQGPLSSCRHHPWPNAYTSRYTDQMVPQHWHVWKTAATGRAAFMGTAYTTRSGARRAAERWAGRHLRELTYVRECTLADCPRPPRRSISNDSTGEARAEG